MLPVLEARFMAGLILAY